MSGMKGFRPYSRGFISDFKVFKPDFRDVWSDFTDDRYCRVCMDFRLDILDFVLDFRAFLHRISEVVGPLYVKPSTT